MFEITDNAQYTEMVNAFVKNNFAEASAEDLKKQVSAGSANILQEGDTVELPKDGKLYVNKAMNNALVIIAQVTNKNGVKRYMPFYPSSLTKSVCVVTTDSDGEVTDEKFVEAQGSAAAEYQKFANMEVGEAVKKFNEAHPAGFKVSGVKKVKTYGFDRENKCRDTSRLVNTNIYTFDLV